MYYEGDPVQSIDRMVSENAVVIFSTTTCYMCHTVKRLFRGMGVSATVYELDEEPEGKELERALKRLQYGATLPVVFIGGQLVGSVDRVLASHISGSLVPLLKQAGALWL